MKTVLKLKDHVSRQQLISFLLSESQSSISFDTNFKVPLMVCGVPLILGLQFFSKTINRMSFFYFILFLL